MAIPTFIGLGSKSASTTDLTVGMPASILANDVMLMFAESQNETISLGTANGFASVGTNAVGTSGAPAATRLSIFWKRAVGSDSSPIITAPGDHCLARIALFRGCRTSGDPFEVTNGGTQAGTVTAVSVTGNTTTLADCLVVAAVSGATDTTTAQSSGEANASLSSVAEIIDDWTTTAGGGGFAVYTGGKAAAGAYSATTATLATATVQAFRSLALVGVSAAGPTTFAGMIPI